MASKYSRLDRKVVQGATVAAAAVAGSALAVAAINSDSPFEYLSRLAWALQSDIYTSVGVPSFIAGVLFFPVGFKTLSSRWGLTARAALTAAAVSFVNRVLVWSSYARPDSLPEGLKEVWANPGALIPVPSDAVLFGLDWNALLGLSATALAGVLAYAAQPMLKKISRSPRLEAISTFDATPARVPARTTVR